MSQKISKESLKNPNKDFIANAITDGTLTEDALQKSKKELAAYKYALDESSIVAITDQKGIINYVNDNFCKISKYSREELIGQDHRIVNSGFHSKEFIRNKWVTIANGKVWRDEIKNKAKDGTYYWVDTTIVPFLNQQGKPYQYVAIRSDITKRKKLEEQQALFVSIVNSSDDAILSKTLDGIVTTWNHGAEKVFGYTAKEIIGKSISILIPPHLEHEEKEIVEKIRKDEYVDHYETERVRKDGKIINVSLTISPIKDSLGNIIGASKISRNITAQKESEKKIIKANRLYFFISQINQMIVRTKDKETVFKESCRIAVELGKFRMAWIGMIDEKTKMVIPVMHAGEDSNYITHIKTMTVDDVPEGRGPTGRVLREGKYIVCNDILNDPQMGPWKEIATKRGYLSLMTLPITQFGKVVGAFSFYAAEKNFFDEAEIALLVEATGDVSFALENFEKEEHREKTEENLVRSETRLKEAQAISHTGNWQIDFTDNTQTWSDEMYNIYGINKDEVEPTTELFLSLMHPDDAEFANKEVQKVFETGIGTAFNFRFIRKDGSPRHGYSVARFEFDKNNKPIRLYGIVEDITERKLAEEEREKITADLLQRNKDLEQFTYIVSHNLRSPVANIMGVSGMLRTANLEEEEKEELMFSLSASVIKLNGVILDLNNILQTKRNVSEKRETVSFSHLIKNIKISISEQIKEEQVEIITDFSEVDKMLTLKSYLYSVFYNLISNSIKYRQPSLAPVIEIKSHLVNDKIELHYKDNGLGIDMDKRGEQVFGLYKRFHTHKEGKGMGLFMVKTQVETLGGKITIESEVNKGTKFLIQFPA